MRIAPHTHTPTRTEKISTRHVFAMINWIIIEDHVTNVYLQQQQGMSISICLNEPNTTLWLTTHGLCNMERVFKANTLTIDQSMICVPGKEQYWYCSDACAYSQASRVINVISSIIRFIIERTCMHSVHAQDN